MIVNTLILNIEAQNLCIPKKLTIYVKKKHWKVPCVSANVKIIYVKWLQAFIYESEILYSMKKEKN